MEDQTQLTVSPTLIVWVAGTNDIELFGPTWTVKVAAVTERNSSCAVALTCQESRRMIEVTSVRIERDRLIINQKSSQCIFAAELSRAYCTGSIRSVIGRGQSGDYLRISGRKSLVVTTMVPFMPSEQWTLQ